MFAPGWIIPYRWLQALPAWLGKGYHEQLGGRSALGLVLLAGAAIMALALSWQHRLAGNYSRIGWSRLLFPVTGMAVIKAGSYFIEQQINIEARR